jgi:hypothetical protein
MANYYFRNTLDPNWGTATNWSLTDGGGSAGVVPGSADSVFFTSNSGNCTVNSVARTANNLNFSGYTNTITFDFNVTITGNLTRSASIFGYLGTGGIIIAGTTTQIITTSSVAWTIPVTFGGASPNISINGAFNITAPLTLSSTTSPVIARANVLDLTENVHPSGNITISSNGTYTGSANIVVSGSNNQTLTASGNHQIRNNLTIDKTGGVLTLSGTLNYGNPSGVSTLTYVASGGTVNAGSSTLNIRASATLNTNGVTWNNVTLNSGAIALTLTSNFNIAGTFSATGLGGGLVLTFSGTGLFNPTGGFIVSNTSVIGNSNINITLPNDINITSLTYPDQPGLTNRRTVALNGLRNITVSNTVSIGIGQGSDFSGNCTLIYTGNSTFYLAGGTVYSGGYSLSTTINTSGTCTFTTNVVGGQNTYPSFQTTTITHVSGNVAISGTGNNYILFTSCVLNISNAFSSIPIRLGNNTTIQSNTTFGDLTTQTTTVAFAGAFTVNVEGNLAINITTSGASTPIVINGTGSQTWTATAYLSNNLTINKASGTLTLGSIVYYSTGTLIHTLGNVDVITNSNTFQTVNATINTSNITWNNFFFASGGANTMTLANNLYISNTFTCGGQGTISGAFNIYCGNCNINNSSSGATNTTITYSGIIYCSNNLTYSGNTGVSSITGTVYVSGSVFFNAPASTQGAGNIYMVGNGVISSLNIIYPINTNLYFDTGGKITISTPINFANGAARIINLIRGNIDASKCDLYLNQSFNHTLTNMNKIAFRGVYLGNNASLTMNEFFSGKPNLKTIVASSVASNYTVTFTDNFEKIAKFVTITNCTLSRPQQLLVITDSKKSSTNTRGIRYINSLPNGISKGDPSIQNILTPGQSNNLLIGDPAFVKTI